MVVAKKDVARPVRRAETVATEDLGEVVVRQMALTPYLDSVRRAVNGELPIAAMLADCVVDAAGEPIFSEAEWEVWGARHLKTMWVLYDKVRALSNLDPEAAEKN